MNRFAALALLTVTAVLAGCSSSSSSAPVPTPTPSPTVTATTPAPSSSAAPSASPSQSPSQSATTTSAAGPVRCHTSELGVEKGEGQGAAGSLYQTVLLVNRSAQPCLIFGFPGLGLLDAAGKTLPSAVTRGESKPTSILVAPAGKTNFTFRYTENPSGLDTEAACPAASRLIVTPPDETESLTVAFAGGPCRGKLTVSPVVAGIEGSTP